jgi:autotransporter-associated beta strand protein
MEGSGSIYLNGMFLEVGFNNLSTVFSGAILDGGSGEGTGGTLYKEGTGTLTLSGPNSYTGGTAIDDGVLLVTTKGASPTGTGDVSVNQGILRGTSRLAGAISVGVGNAACYLAPGVDGIGTLSTQKSITFGGNSSYLCEVDTKRKRDDAVSAKGVKILTANTFTLISLGNRSLPVGTAFTVINNTAGKAISGRFGNLADGATISAGANHFQANYEGGTGNDLTLTVVP